MTHFCCRCQGRIDAQAAVELLVCQDNGYDLALFLHGTCARALAETLEAAGRSQEHQYLRQRSQGLPTRDSRGQIVAS